MNNIYKFSAVLLLSFLAAVKGERIFVAAPNAFRINNDETVFVVCKTAVKDAEIYLNHKTNEAKKISLVRKSFQPNVPDVVQMKITSEDLPKSWDGGQLHFTLNVKFGDFHKSTPVLLDLKGVTVFIQTDKPIYTPKQTVHFRVFPLGINLKPNEGKVIVDVKNPQGIRVRRITREKLEEKGFTTESIKLTEYPEIGIWSITALYGVQGLLNSSVTFEVREYVLPKYSVRIQAAPYLSERNKSIDFSVIARYTYGKAVKGLLSLRVGVLRQNKPTSIYVESVPIDGKEDFSLDADLITKPSAIPSFPLGAKLRIEAEVVERATGNREKTVASSIHVVKSPFRIIFKRSALFYRPGLPFKLLIDVIHPNNIPVPDLKLKINGTAGGQELLNKDGITNEVRTNKFGQTQFVVDTPLNVKRDVPIMLKVKTLHGKEENIEVEVKIQQYQSISGKYIVVRGPETTPKVKSNVNVEVLVPQAQKEVGQLFYLVISRGRIVKEGVVEKNINLVTTIRLTVDASMSPGCRVLAYYVVNNEVVADSTRFDVEKEFENTVSLSSKKTTFVPSEDTVVTVTTTPGSTVGILGVDSSIYLLRNESVLARQTVFSQIDSYDLGCGHGGGLNIIDVFERVGLAVITDADLSTPQRNSIQCPKEVSSRRRRRRDVSSVLEAVLTECLSKAQCRNAVYKKNAKNCKEAAESLPVLLGCRDRFLNCCKEFKGKGRSTFDENLNNFGQGDLEVDETNEEGNLQQRNYFPEVMVWEEATLAGKKSQLFNITIPDSLTTWVVSAVSLNKETGFGISHPLELTSSLKFFVDIKMPYSVRRREQVVVYAVLYNYNRNRIKVNLYLVGHHKFCSIAKPRKRSERMSVYVNGNDALAVPYTIIPMQTGSIPIQFVAFSIDGSDGVTKEFLVIPEGVPQIKTQTITLDPQGIMEDKGDGKSLRKDGTQTDTLELTIPTDFVKGSTKAMVYVTGSLMGSVVNHAIEGNFDNIIKLPTGCGEQVMMKMAPLVYTLRYLEKADDQLTDVIEKKIYKFMRSGYQQALKYKQFDGSFGVYQSKPGITWLTAFVVKVFCQASQFMKEDIDERIICDAMQFLDTRQRGDGVFLERQRVYHTEMLGGVQGDIAMTAFVLIALLECSGRCQEAKQNSISMATAYLEGTYGRIDSPYVLSLATYALVLADSPEKINANRRLKRFMRKETIKGEKVYYWQQGNVSATALNIEMTSYALLTQLELGDIKGSGPIVVWLTHQRNSRGSFFSTQDTCVALQALATYSIKTQGGNLDLTVKFSSEKNTKEEEVFKVTPKNALVRQQKEITYAIGGNVYVDTSGKGTAQLQVVLEYNRPDMQQSLSAYEITVKIEEVTAEGNVMSDAPVLQRKKRGIRKRKRCKSIRNKKKRKQCKKRRKKEKEEKNKEKPQADVVVKEMKLHICVRDKDTVASDMAIIDIGMLTGFKPNIDSVKKLMTNTTQFPVNNYELLDNHLILHVDKIPSKEKACFDITTTRESTVGMVQEAPVKVFDYYEPGDSATTFYAPSKGSGLLNMICDGEECECAYGGCGNCEAEYTMKDLLSFACTRADFVFRGKVSRKTPGEKWTEFVVFVNDIVKQGSLERKDNAKITMFRMSQCSCKHPKVGKEYLFMLKDGIQYILGGDAVVYKWPDGNSSDLQFEMDKVKSRGECDKYDPIY